MSGTETLWQELICRLEGVQAAQVVFAENGMPCEIHVLAGPEKSSKSLVRDIQSALTAQFGVQVDHRIISVAQLSEGLVPRGDFRLAHTGLEIKSAGGRVSASVTLARGCDTYTGHGESANTPFARRRCVSEAALAALSAAHYSRSSPRGGGDAGGTGYRGDAGVQPAGWPTPAWQRIFK